MATEIFIPNRTREMGVRSVDRRIHLRLRIPTQVAGMDLVGQDFVEEGHTVLIAPSGAIIECDRALGPDQEVSLRVGKREVLARVLGQAGLSESKYVYGISFMQPDASFWGVHFPSSEVATTSASAVLIECGRCATQRAYVVNEIEALILTASRSFGLYCSGCKDSTLWKASAGESVLSPNETMISAKSSVDSEPRDSSGRNGARQNQRKHNRLDLARAKACVQRPNSDEETVDLVNVSRGGASFRSHNSYFLGCWIRIAAPCIVGAANIFVLARVVRATRILTSSEYGVEYVETSS